ncbi:DUF2169 family type VI secretion system accessory protein [Cupriavidus sp. D39]|uniref:DUF2169 family type VI secretion system accessory protein n=1 Tax=Cupriavidus sp. D39 TaxID=2997877 RepID=UPI00226D6A40|nr:DUF2169 domain-containing protein [Cupriavidus sp. D39]MCY0858678.1 DUF2169 domain-containing protein [Cupriavidus sp. D39]
MFALQRRIDEGIIVQIRKEFTHVLIPGCYQWRGLYRLAVGVGFFFAFDDPETPLQETDLWNLAHAQLGAKQPLDLGRPKGRPEILVGGACHAPEGTQVSLLHVSVQLGGLNKRLDVFGDRHWLRRGGTELPSDPKPFAEMPVALSRAFGGDGYGPNPEGKGYLNNPGEAVRVRLSLPNVEYPRRRVASPQDRPPPASMVGGVALAPDRMRWAGACDATWARDHAPAYPDDLDLRLFNLAPEDQWLDRWFSGGESVVVENMHPRHRRQDIRLPTRRPRVFVERKADGDGRFAEVALHAETLWLFPGEERGLLLWRGELNVSDEEADDVARLFVVDEPPGAPALPMSHYRERWRCDEHFAMPAAIRELTEKGKRALAESEQKRQRTEEEFGRSHPHLAKELAEAKAMTRPRPRPHSGEGKHRGIPDRAEVLARATQGLPFKGLLLIDLDLCGEKLTGVDFSGALFLRCLMMEANLQGANLSEAAFTECDLAGADLSLVRMENTRFSESNMRKALLRQATGSALFAECDCSGTDWRGASVEVTVSKGSMAGATFAQVRGLGLICTGSKVDGADFTEARLSRALFSDSTLSGAKFEAASLLRSMFSRVQAAEVDFTTADLSSSCGQDSDFHGSRFSGAKLQNGSFRECSFDDTEWERADLCERLMERCSLRRANLYHVSARAAKFSRCDFEDACLVGANLMEGTLRHSRLAGVDLRGANLFRVDASCVEAAGLRLDDALVDEFRLRERQGR